MKIKQKKSQTKKVIISTVIILFILACGYTGLALKQHLWPFPPLETVTQAEKDAANNFPSTNSPKTDTPVVDSGKSSTSTPPQNTSQVPTSQSLSATITQLEEKGSTIYFAAAISGASDPGTCVVNFTNPNDKPVTKQVTGTVKDGAVACGPIQISNLEFSYLGSWSVDFHFYTAGEQTTTNGTINIR